MTSKLPTLTVLVLLGAAASTVAQSPGTDIEIRFSGTVPYGGQALLTLAFPGEQVPDHVNVSWNSEDDLVESGARDNVSTSEPVSLQLGGTSLGRDTLLVQIRSPGFTWNESLPVFVRPQLDVTASLGEGSTEPRSRLFVPADTLPRELRLDIHNRGSVPLNGTLEWDEYRWDVALDAGEGQTQPLRWEHGGFIDDTVVFHANGTSVVTSNLQIEPCPGPFCQAPGPIEVEGTLRDDGAHVALRTLGVAGETAVRAEVHLSPTVPDPTCASTVDTFTLRFIEQTWRWTNRTLAWDCDAPGRGELSFWHDRARFPYQRETISLASAQTPETPDVRTASFPRVGETLIEGTGAPDATVVAWPSDGRRAQIGPAYPQGWYLDDGDGVRWPGEYDVWIDHQGALVHVGEVDVAGSTPSLWLSLALLPVYLGLRLVARSPVRLPEP